MKRTIKYLSLIILLTVAYSCSVSSDVVSKNHIQKRKYRKGWFIDFNGKHESVKNSVDEPESYEEITAINQDAQVSDGKNTLAVTDNPDESSIQNSGDLQTLNSPEDYSELELVEKPVNSERYRPKKINKKDEVRELPDPYIDNYKEAARDNYKKTWIITSIAIFSLGIGILVLVYANLIFHTIFGIALLGLALVMYIMMFIYLYRTGAQIYNFMDAGGELAQIGVLRFFLHAHIIVGSFFSLIFFLIPLISTYVSINRYKKRTSS